MRLKLDENLPALSVEWLRELGHDAEHVRDEGLLSRPDEEVWEASQREGRTVVTTDLDFGDIAMRTAQHFGIILLRPTQAHRAVLDAMLRRIVTDPRFEVCTSRIVVVEDRRTRVRPRFSLINPEDSSP